MPDTDSNDARNDARTRWLNGDPYAWVRYAESCLQFEADLQAAKQSRPMAAPSSGCGRCTSCRCEASEGSAAA